MNKKQNVNSIDRFSSFLLRVLRAFKRNQGLLLSGAVAYYTLLSIVPMSILALIVLSQFIEGEQLFHTLSTYLEMVIPGYAATLTEQVRVFIEHRKVIGIIGFLVMLFFSSIAFKVLENAMSVIFFHRVRKRWTPEIGQSYKVLKYTIDRRLHRDEQDKEEPIFWGFQGKGSA